MKVTERVRLLAEPVVAAQGCELWDVEYVREGGGWFLRVYIDKDGGVDISDCEAVSRALDPMLDEADPISQAYFLEVSSPGIERELSRPEHFEAMKGRDVSVNLYRPTEDGTKEIIATLIGLDGDSILLTDLDGTEFAINRKDAASVRLYDCEDDFSAADGGLDETEN